jgi:hypothetical protein
MSRIDPVFRLVFERRNQQPALGENDPCGVLLRALRLAASELFDKGEAP